MSFIIAIVVALMGTTSALNCLRDNVVDFVYNIYDPSQNYTNVKEYWLKRDTSCDWLVEHTNKLTWYSTSISARAQPYYGQDCRAKKRPVAYVKGTHFEIPGPEDICQIKYIIRNKNKDADLRITLWRDGIPADKASMIAWSAFAGVAAMASSFF